MPCVLGIDSQMNVPRLPTVLQVMKVKADRIARVSLSDAGLSPGAQELATCAQLVAYGSAAVVRKRVVLEGPAQECAVRLVESLVQEGVL